MRVENWKSDMFFSMRKYDFDEEFDLDFDFIENKDEEAFYLHQDVYYSNVTT